MTFTNPDKEDLGRYSVVVTNTDGVSASQTLTEDGRRHEHTFYFLMLSAASLDGRVSGPLTS